MPQEVQEICDIACSLHYRIHEPARYLEDNDIRVIKLIDVRTDLQLLKNLFISLLRKMESFEEVADMEIDEEVTEGKKTSTHKTTVLKKLEGDLKANEENIIQLEETTIRDLKTFSRYVMTIRQFLALVYTLMSELKEKLYEQLEYNPNTIPYSTHQLHMEINRSLYLLSDYIALIKRYQRTDKAEMVSEYFYQIRNNFNSFGQDKFMEHAKTHFPTLTEFSIETPKIEAKKPYRKDLFDLVERELDRLFTHREKQIIFQQNKIQAISHEHLDTFTRKTYGYSKSDLEVMVESLAEVAVHHVGLLVSHTQAKKIQKKQIIKSGDKEVGVEELSDEDVDKLLGVGGEE
jgi:hypothetical protein